MRRQNSNGRLKWILASASPRRREILRGLGLRFRVEPSNLKEPERNAAESPQDYVVRLATLKAREVGGRHKSGTIIAADTVVVVDGLILGKPAAKKEARSMLLRLSGRWHSVLTAIAVFECASGRTRAEYSRSRVHFRPLEKTDVDWYLSTGEFADKAGAYAVQGYASLFIDRIDGCYFNVVGFPVATFEQTCRKLGIDLKTQIDSKSKQATNSTNCTKKK
jgi:septum formation protein